jgi:hypothetical protein
MIVRTTWPFRSENAADAAERLADKNKELRELQDWEVERIYTDWLNKAGVFTPVG